MTSARVSRLHRALIAALVTTYVAAGIIGLFVDAVDQKALWAVVLFGGAALIVVGAVLRVGPAQLSAVLVSIGAIAGGITLIWTVVVPLAAALLVAMTFALSRREHPA